MKPRTKHRLIYNSIETIFMAVTFALVYNYGDNPTLINFVCILIGVVFIAIASNLDAHFGPKYERMAMFKDGINKGWDAAIEEAKKALDEAREEVDNKPLSGDEDQSDMTLEDHMKDRSRILWMIKACASGQYIKNKRGYLFEEQSPLDKEKNK